MLDDYTTEARLCDDKGMISYEKLDPPKAINPDLTYLGLINLWLRKTAAVRGDEHPTQVEEPFPCTGSAHLIGEHIRCTSPAHVPEL